MTLYNYFFKKKITFTGELIRPAMSYAFRIREYLRYRFHAKSEFKVHSPFVYDFYTKVILAKDRLPESLIRVEDFRKNMEKSFQEIHVTDLGTGAKTKPESRKIKENMRHYASQKKDAFLLYRIVCFLKPSSVLELGTSLGMSAMYMASADRNIPLTTIEACGQTAALAKKNFDALSLPVKLIEGNVDEILGPLLAKISQVDMVFFDANHTREATLRYFYQCMEYANDKTIFIFDDIYWSQGMKDAWEEICSRPEVRTSIDLYSMGIVFFDKKIAKQHFVLKY